MALHTEEAPQWYRLSLAKYRYPDAAFLNRKEFDKGRLNRVDILANLLTCARIVLGNCEVVTDMPSAAFAVELLRAYPEAKVVLNRRRDVDKWHASMMATLGNMYSDWGSWARQWVEAENFWLMRIVRAGFYPKYRWDVARHGVEVYNQHYADLEAECRRQGREWLDWTVQDGWEPLCKFVGKPTPETPFPNENAVGGFAEKRLQLHQERFRRANRRLMICRWLIAMGGVLGGVWWWRDSDLVRSLLRRLG